MLVNAKKMYKNKTSNYHVTTIANEFEKTSTGYLGKLRGRRYFQLVLGSEQIASYH